MKCLLLLFIVNFYLCAGDDDVEKAFKSNEIVADVISTAPHEKLDVKYKDTDKEPSLGNEIAPKDVREIPEIKYDSDDKALYTLAMIDPDAPSRKNPIRREFLHWLVVNVPGGDISKGETINEYIGSGPPKDSGLHRYIFLLYKQPEKINVEESRSTRTQIKGRPKFSIKKFAEKYKLGNPVAGNFYQAQYDDSVPALHRQFMPH